MVLLFRYIWLLLYCYGCSIYAFIDKAVQLQVDLQIFVLLRIMVWTVIKQSVYCKYIAASEKDRED